MCKLENQGSCHRYSVQAWRNQKQRSREEILLNSMPEIPGEHCHSSWRICPVEQFWCRSPERHLLCTQIWVSVSESWALPLGWLLTSDQVSHTSFPTKTFLIQSEEQCYVQNYINHQGKRKHTALRSVQKPPNPLTSPSVGHADISQFSSVLVESPIPEKARELRAETEERGKWTVSPTTRCRKDLCMTNEEDSL